MRLGRGSPNTINDHLDVWWTKLGSRPRDLPGQEFPQLPECVAKSLQGLWNQALETQRAALEDGLRMAQLEEANQRARTLEDTLQNRDEEASSRTRPVRRVAS